MKPLHYLFVIGILQLTVYQVYASGGCGNNASHGVASCKCGKCDTTIITGDPFNPYTGNEHREIEDLVVWNSVGEIPLVWKRYYNSREFRGWTYSFQFSMADEGLNSLGQAQVSVWFPEGGVVFFAQSNSNPSVWLPVAGVEERLYQQGNNFTLQNSKGHRYRFKKLNTQPGSMYELQEIWDNFQNVYKLSYNGNHLLRRVSEPAGRFLEMNYTTIAGTEMLSKVTSSDGRSVMYNYDLYNDGISSYARLISVNYGDGTQALYTYTQPIPAMYPSEREPYPIGFVFLAHAVDPRYTGTNVNMKFTYDNSIAHGYIREEINGVTGQVMTTLSADENNRWICYANGRIQHLFMPTELLGKPKEYTDGLAKKTIYTYDDVNGFLSSKTDAGQRVTTYTRSMYGNHLEIIHPDGSKETWERDDLDMILVYTDQLNRVTTYVRDNRHRVRKIMYPDGTTERFTYNNFGQVLTHTLPNGGIEYNTYDSRGLKTSYKDALANITRYTYDEADRLESVTDARNNTTRYEYTERGLLIKKVHPDNSFLIYTYDNFGNRTTITNEINNTWTMLFDEFKRIVSKADPLNRITKYHYDLPGGGCGCSHDHPSPTKIESPGGLITVIEYDVEWKKIRQTVGAGSGDEASTFYEYNLLGNLITIIDPRGNSWIYDYDVRDRRKGITDPLGNLTQYEYDFAGNVVTVKRPDNGTTVNVYDPMNRLIESTDAKGQTRKMKFDNSGNIIKLTDLNNRNYTFEYDLLDRQTRMNYPGGSFEAYTFDPVSNLKTFINRSGKVRTYTYNNRDRELIATWSDNTPEVIKTYDAATRIISLSSSVSVLVYTYNAANELTSESQVIAGEPAAPKVSYTYTNDGLRNTMAYPGGTIVNYTYTDRNEIKNINADGSALSSYMYDLNGNRINKALANGTHTLYTYDKANKMLTVDNYAASTSFARFDYAYDNVDRRTFVKRNGDKGDVYAYDAIDQLTGVRYDVINPEGTSSNPLRTVNYNFDASGNRIKVEDNGTTTGYTSNNRNQYRNVGGTPLAYDANGNLRTLNGWAYAYDAQDRLIRARKGDSIVTFAYDSRDRCVKRTVNGLATYYYYDGWNLIEERNIGNELLTHYVHGAKTDELLLKVSSHGNIYFHQDALGNVTHLTNSSGVIVEQYSYDVFGSQTIRDNAGNIIPASAYGNRFMFTGREFLKEVGLYDYRNRIYSATLGRFMQVDPIRFKARDLNLYRYVNNNPVNLVDPYGLAPAGYWECVGKILKCELLTVTCAASIPCCWFSCKAVCIGTLGTACWSCVLACGGGAVLVCLEMINCWTEASAMFCV